jgi:hypothetical protein
VGQHRSRPALSARGQKALSIDSTFNSEMSLSTLQGITWATQSKVPDSDEIVGDLA